MKRTAHLAMILATLALVACGGGKKKGSICVSGQDCPAGQGCYLEACVALCATSCDTSQTCVVIDGNAVCVESQLVSKQGTETQDMTPDNGAEDTGDDSKLGTEDQSADKISGSEDQSTLDNGTPDSGTPDSGTPDSSNPDLGTPDVIVSDTTPPPLSGLRQRRGQRLGRAGACARGLSRPADHGWDRELQLEGAHLVELPAHAAEPDDGVSERDHQLPVQRRWQERFGRGRGHRRQ